jgi:type I restriction enzyme S subunit
MLDPAPGLVVSTGFVTITPVGIGPAFMSAVAADDDFVAFLTASAGGSAYPAVRPDSVGRYPLVLPSQSQLEAFERELMPLLRLSNQVGHESRAVTLLRDALLPELLSGRLRVPEAREQVEAVV